MLNTCTLDKIRTVRRLVENRSLSIGQQEAIVRRWQRDVSLLTTRAAAGNGLAARELASAQTSLVAAQARLTWLQS